MPEHPPFSVLLRPRERCAAVLLGSRLGIANEARRSAFSNWGPELSTYT